MCKHRVCGDCIAFERDNNKCWYCLNSKVYKGDPACMWWRSEVSKHPTHEEVDNAKTAKA